MFFTGHRDGFSVFKIVFYLLIKATAGPIATSTVIITIGATSQDGIERRGGSRDTGSGTGGTGRGKTWTG